LPKLTLLGDEGGVRASEGEGQRGYFAPDFNMGPSKRKTKRFMKKSPLTPSQSTYKHGSPTPTLLFATGPIFLSSAPGGVTRWQG